LLNGLDHIVDGFGQLSRITFFEIKNVIRRRSRTILLKMVIDVLLNPTHILVSIEIGPREDTFDTFERIATSL
jgi:hypothetical protein